MRVTIYSMLNPHPHFLHEEVTVAPEVAETTMRKFWHEQQNDPGLYLAVLV
jgi:hypothetical protein